MSNEYFYARGEEQFGPVSSQQLRQLANTGQLLPTDLIWKEGMADWVPAERIRALSLTTKQPYASPPPPPLLSPQNEFEPNPPASTSATPAVDFDFTQGQAAVRELGAQATVAGRRAATVAKAATGDAITAFRAMMTNPVGGMRVAIDNLGAVRAMQAGIVFCVVYDLACLLGTRFLISGWMHNADPSFSDGPTRGGPDLSAGDFLKLLVLGFLPLITATAGFACSRLLFRGSGSVHSDIFVAGASLLPIGLGVLTAGIVGVANIEIVIAIAVFAISTKILMLYSGCTTVQKIPDAAAVIAVPLMILIDAWLGKVIVFAVFS